MSKFEVVSEFSPAGDQPQAVEHLAEGVNRGERFQTLLGITGSGKSATIAWTIEQVQRPTLIIAPNKSLAAQLAAEVLDIGQVIAKINDPVRAEAYADLGIATLCRTGLMEDAINAYLGLPVSGLAGMLAPRGTHPGGHHRNADASRPSGAEPASVGTSTVEA